MTLNAMWFCSTPALHVWWQLLLLSQVMLQSQAISMVCTVKDLELVTTIWRLRTRRTPEASISTYCIGPPTQHASMRCEHMPDKVELLHPGRPGVDPPHSLPCPTTDHIPRGSQFVSLYSSGRSLALLLRLGP
jgi:hypothetical protein